MDNVVLLPDDAVRVGGRMILMDQGPGPAPAAHMNMFAIGGVVMSPAPLLQKARWLMELWEGELILLPSRKWQGSDKVLGVGWAGLMTGYLNAPDAHWGNRIK